MAKTSSKRSTNHHRPYDPQRNKLSPEGQIKLTNWDRIEMQMGASYSSGLPFEIHNSDNAQPTYIREKCDHGDHDRFRLLHEAIDGWEPVHAAIADKALKCGMRISIPCPPAYAVDIAVLFAQKVPAMKIAFYDHRHKRIVFRVVDEDQARIDAEKMDVFENHQRRRPDRCVAERKQK